MSIITRTEHFICQDSQEFHTKFRPVDGTERVKIQGDKAIVYYLSHDEANGWYFDEFDNGQFINMDSRCRGERKTKEEIQELLMANKGRAFFIDKYEHGLVRYYRHTNTELSATIPDKQWDVSGACALFIVPDDVTNPAEYCDATMEEFTNWCNGEIYGICHTEYTKVDGTWKEKEEDACWGYIGYSEALKEMEDEFKSTEL